jgi:peptide chain release factor 2
MEEIKDKLVNLQQRLVELTTLLDINRLRAEIKALESTTSSADFWAQEERARQVMQELAALKEDVSLVDDLTAQIEEARALIAMAESETDSEAVVDDLTNTYYTLEKKFKQLEIKKFLSGTYDATNAIVSIHAGQGGTEAMDWAEMLKRMYVRFAERKGWKYEILNESMGEETGIKSVTVLFSGHHAYGYLKKDSGTHRLVRLSPFNADSLRQTSFAQVEVLPEIDTNQTNVIVRDDDLEWSFSRSSGKGGQNVNKVSTAVRVKHIPTGIVVECQAQRTQVQNRKLALSILTARLDELMREQQAKEIADLKGGYTPASWGTQIRNYVLHPYHLVKDLRTQVETSNTQAVLDGDIEAFIEAEIKLPS